MTRQKKCPIVRGWLKIFVAGSTFDWTGPVQNSYRPMKLKCRLSEGHARIFYGGWGRGGGGGGGWSVEGEGGGGVGGPTFSLQCSVHLHVTLLINFLAAVLYTHRLFLVWARVGHVSFLPVRVLRLDRHHIYFRFGRPGGRGLDGVAARRGRGLGRKVALLFPRLHWFSRRFFLLVVFLPRLVAILTGQGLFFGVGRDLVVVEELLFEGEVFELPPAQHGQHSDRHDNQAGEHGQQQRGEVTGAGLGTRQHTITQSSCTVMILQ